MGSLITYSAIAAKLAAMRGHFLTDDEFSVLAGMENVPAATPSTVISQGCSDSQTEPRENFWISTFSISRSMS